MQTGPNKNGLLGQYFSVNGVVITDVKFWVASPGIDFTSAVCRLLFIIGKNYAVNCCEYVENSVLLLKTRSIQQC